MRNRGENDDASVTLAGTVVEQRAISCLLTAEIRSVRHTGTAWIVVAWQQMNRLFYSD